MNNKEGQPTEVVIKISTDAPASGTEEKKELADQKLKDGYQFLNDLSILPAIRKRNSHYGRIEIHTLEFAEPNQREVALRILDNPAIDEFLPEIYKYIFKLGCDDNGEKRYYAAQAVAKLATIHPLVDLEQIIIQPWAKSLNYDVQITAAIAIATIIEQKKWRNNIFKLVNHWFSLNNNSLNDTALSVYRIVYNKYPQNVLDTIKKLAQRNSQVLMHWYIELIKSIYDYDPYIIISNLKEWISENNEQNLRWIASQSFINIVQIEDVIERHEVYPDVYKIIVELIYTLLEDSELHMHYKFQKYTIKIVEKLAENSLSTKIDNKALKSYKKLFQCLNERYDEESFNRLYSLLEKCQKDREWKRENAKRWPEKTGEIKKYPGSFFDLIKQE